MAKFPPPAADRPLLAQLKRGRHRPGLSPATANLSADTLRGLRDAVTQGPGKVLASALARYTAGRGPAQRLPRHRPRRLGHGLHRCGRSATGSASAASAASIATYPVALFDYTRRRSPGSNRYVVHIPKSSLPIPVRAFWSLTLYDTQLVLRPQPLDRYLVNNRSHLRSNPDGSIDIYVQHDQPSDPHRSATGCPRPRPDSASG